MSKVTVYGTDGKEAGEVEVPDALLETAKGTQAVHDAVVATMARRRAGTASTLEKGEVAGSNRKPWRQKGTGRARAGLRQSPVWRGGSVVFGPRPRKYKAKVNKKVGHLAFRRALSEKIVAGEVKVLEKVEIAEPKTRIFAQLLRSLDVGKKALFVLDTVPPAVALAVRNLPNVRVTCAADLSVHDLLRYPVLVVDRPGFDRLTLRLGRTVEAAS